MKELFWYKICPFCNTGRLFIYKNVSAGKLYFHCEECERGYYDPDNISTKGSVLTLMEDYDAVEASDNDLIKFGWEKYALHKIQM
jgi:hypothetical protein